MPTPPEGLVSADVPPDSGGAAPKVVQAARSYSPVEVPHSHCLHKTSNSNSDLPLIAISDGFVLGQECSQIFNDVIRGKVVIHGLNKAKLAEAIRYLDETDIPTKAQRLFYAVLPCLFRLRQQKTEAPSISSQFWSRANEIKHALENGQMTDGQFVQAYRGMLESIHYDTLEQYVVAQGQHQSAYAKELKLIRLLDQEMQLTPDAASPEMLEDVHFEKSYHETLDRRGNLQAVILYQILALYLLTLRVQSKEEKVRWAEDGFDFNQFLAKTVEELKTKTINELYSDEARMLPTDEESKKWAEFLLGGGLSQSIVGDFSELYGMAMEQGRQCKVDIDGVEYGVNVNIAPMVKFAFGEFNDLVMSIDLPVTKADIDLFSDMSDSNPTGYPVHDKTLKERLPDEVMHIEATYVLRRRDDLGWAYEPQDMKVTAASGIGFTNPVLKQVVDEHQERKTDHRSRPIGH